MIVIQPIPVSLLCALLAGLPNEFIRETAEVRVTTRIESQMFYWTIENLGPVPIRRIAFEMHYGYDISVPGGWRYTYREPEFIAWTDESAAALPRGARMTIQGRAGSAGGVLGRSAATVETLAGDTFSVGDVPVPGPRSIALVVVTACTVAGVALAQGALVVRRRRRMAPRR